MISNTILPERIDTVSIYLSSVSSDDVVSFACDVAWFAAADSARFAVQALGQFVTRCCRMTIVIDH